MTHYLALTDLQKLQRLQRNYATLLASATRARPERADWYRVTLDTLRWEMLQLESRLHQQAMRHEKPRREHAEVSRG